MKTEISYHILTEEEQKTKWDADERGYTRIKIHKRLITYRLSEFCKEYLAGKWAFEIPPNPPLEKGGEGGISGLTWNPEKNSFRKMT